MIHHRRDYLRAILLRFALLAAAPGSGQSLYSQVLYNGIVLPQPWPPIQSPTQAYQIPTYITNPPPVIPIDLGRQLFVDDFLIQQTTMTRTQHRPAMFPLNPILTPAPFDSAGFVMPFSDGVWFDPSDRLFKMWLYCGNGNQICYAYSTDGKAWIRPAIPDGVAPGTNVVLQATPGNAPFTGLIVWMDLQDPNPARKFKAFTSTSYAPALLFFSSDGIHWVGTSPSQYPIPMYDRTTYFWNPFRNVWVDSHKAYLNLPAAATRPAYLSRARLYAESPDLSTWTPTYPDISTSFWTGPDGNDPPYVPGGIYPQLYNLDAVAYESVLVGLFNWFHPGPGDDDAANLPGPDLVEIGAGFSRDGFQWVRPTRGSGPGPDGAFIPASNQPGAWDRGNTQSAGGCFLVVGDELWFYFSGRTALHGDPSARGATGMASLRRDGFYSMDAGPFPGVLTTRPVRFSGNNFFVNVRDPQGALQVEVLNPSNGAVLATSVPVSVDKTLQPVSWNGLADLSSFANQPVQLRFTLTNGALYSFWVTASAAGASNGYVAANGPGFTGPTDTLGIGAYPTLAATPEIYPTGGTLAGPTSVTILTRTVGATIYYTLDGSTPTPASPVYGGPFLVTAGTTVKALGAAPGLGISAVATAAFTGASPAAPVVTLQPQSAAVSVGQTATFTVAAAGTGLSYQWQSQAPGAGGFTAIPGALGTSYTTPAAAASDNGKQFRCQVSNAGGAVFSNTATLTVASTGFAIRVRAGGAAYTDPAGNLWAADNGYSGGSPYTTDAAIAGTSAPALYQGERWSLTPFQYQFSVPAGAYHVTLKFSENFATGAGQRVFNVSINGQCALNNIDIFAQAGGSFRAWDQACDLMASGSLAIHFTPVLGAAKIDAIEIVQQTGGPPPVVSVSVAAAVSTVTPPQTATFTATVSGAADASVTWTLAPGAVGIIASSGPTTGLYTPPGTVTAAQVVTAIATSNADPTKTGSASITLLPNGPGGPPPGFTPIRVRAGGAAYTDPAGNLWAADNGYSGGSAYTTGAAIAGTGAPALYQGERWSLTPFQYQFSVPAAVYHVTLKFSENFATGAGQRVFSVSINGQCALNNIDIFAQAGGGFRASDQACDVTASGSVAIQFTPVVGAAKIDAIEIVQQSGGPPPVVSVSVAAAVSTVTPPQSATFTATVSGAGDTSVTWTLAPGAVGSIASSGPTTGLYTPPGTVTAAQVVTAIATSNADPTKTGSVSITLLPNGPGGPPGFTPIRIRAGGAAYMDPAGNLWAADNGYSGGSAYSTGAAITGTSAQALYQTERWSLTPIQYQFAVPAGTYHVTLKFSENFATGAGQRVFNVSINGQCALNNIDIFAQAGGGFRAWDQACDVTASGSVAIQFTPVVGAAKIDAIEILGN